MIHTVDTDGREGPESTPIPVVISTDPKAPGDITVTVTINVSP